MGNNSINGLTLLGVAFIILKLCKVIDWSWWWVTVPFWGGLVLMVPISIIFFYIKKRESKKEFEIYKQRQENKSNNKSKFQERLEKMQEMKREQMKNR